MAGLVPAIHVLLPCHDKEDVDARHIYAKTRFALLAGHDEEICMPSDAPAWSLHSQLTNDTIDIGDLPLCRVLVVKDAHYPWLLLVPRRRGAVEIIDLDEADQQQLARETALASRALKYVTNCDKLNVAAIGNVVSQLHMHVIARRRDDAAWPKPVWNAIAPRPYDEGTRQKLIAAIGASLPVLPP